MLVRLNRETREHHADADAAWHELLVPDVSRDRYVDQLIRVYGFEAPLEGALAYAPAMDTAKRREHARSGRIVEDLLVLGLRPAQISELPQCREISPFSDFHTALGWLYALERATLIHGMLRRHLVGALPDVSRATKYLGASEGSIANRWRELGVAFEEAGEREDHAVKVIQAATAALTAQRRWFSSPRQASAASH